MLDPVSERDGVGHTLAAMSIDKRRWNTRLLPVLDRLRVERIHATGAASHTTIIDRAAAARVYALETLDDIVERGMLSR